MMIMIMIMIGSALYSTYIILYPHIGGDISDIPHHISPWISTWMEGFKVTSCADLRKANWAAAAACGAERPRDVLRIWGTWFDTWVPRRSSNVSGGNSNHAWRPIGQSWSKEVMFCALEWAGMIWYDFDAKELAQKTPPALRCKLTWPSGVPGGQPRCFPRPLPNLPSHQCPETVRFLQQRAPSKQRGRAATVQWQKPGKHGENIQLTMGSTPHMPSGFAKSYYPIW